MSENCPTCGQKIPLPPPPPKYPSGWTTGEADFVKIIEDWSSDDPRVQDFLKVAQETFPNAHLVLARWAGDCLNYGDYRQERGLLAVAEKSGENLFYFGPGGPDDLRPEYLDFGNNARSNHRRTILEAKKELDRLETEYQQKNLVT